MPTINIASSRKPPIWTAHYSLPDFQLGRLLWSKKEYSSAADWFQKVPPGDVHYHEANFFLGLCRYHTGDFAGAQAAFQMVARVVPLERGVQRPGGGGISRQYYSGRRG